MADHGSTFGALRTTEQGPIEANNPFMFISVPKHMRNNKDLINQLYANSKQLLTQHDVYATLLELAQVSHNTINSDLRTV
jgi:hypothetical protein